MTVSRFSPPVDADGLRAGQWLLGSPTPSDCLPRAPQDASRSPWERGLKRAQGETRAVGGAPVLGKGFLHPPGL